MAMRVVLVVALLGFRAAAAQTGEVAAALGALERDRASLAGYRWTSLVEVRLDGAVTGVERFETRRAQDGAIVATPLAVPSAAGVPRGAPRPGKRQERRVREKQRILRELVEDYSALETERIRKAFATAIVTRGDPGQLTLIHARDVRLRGDSLKLWVEADSLRPRRFEVLTALDGEAVRVETEFRTLEGGPSYPARTTVSTEIKEKPLIVTTVNDDFVREAARPERGP